jgi:hypothetical protein
LCLPDSQWTQSSETKLKFITGSNNSNNVFEKADNIMILYSDERIGIHVSITDVPFCKHIVTDIQIFIL